MPKSIRIIVTCLTLCLYLFPFSTISYGVDLSIDFNIILGPAEQKATGFEWIFPMNQAALSPYLIPIKPYTIKDPWNGKAFAKEVGVNNGIRMCI